MRPPCPRSVADPRAPLIPNGKLVSSPSDTMLASVLRFCPLIILGRAGLCKLNVAAPPQVQQVLEEVCVARQEIPLWSSSQNLDDWSSAWAKHWNARLAQQLDAVHELSGTRLAFSVTARQLLLAIGVVELYGWLSLFTNPKRGGLLLFLVMLGAIDTHINGFGQPFEQLVPQLPVQDGPEHP